jgi:hypothetical protein
MSDALSPEIDELKDRVNCEVVCVYEPLALTLYKVITLEGGGSGFVLGTNISPSSEQVPNKYKADRTAAIVKSFFTLISFSLTP